MLGQNGATGVHGAAHAYLRRQTFKVELRTQQPICTYHITTIYVSRLKMFQNIVVCTQVLPDTTSSYLTCSCNHLTTFAGLYFVPPSPVSIADLTLLGQIKHNPVVLSVLILVWTVYLLLMIWAKVRDRRDAMNVGIHTHIMHVKQEN